LAKQEKLTSNSLANQLDKLGKTRLPTWKYMCANPGWHRRGQAKTEGEKSKEGIRVPHASFQEVEGDKHNFVFLSGFLM
jgi:hypothetical protein